MIINTDKEEMDTQARERKYDKNETKNTRVSERASERATQTWMLATEPTDMHVGM